MVSLPAKPAAAGKSSGRTALPERGPV